ncbi:YjgN family protein [Endothiovibrio diazotrophicus]
MSEGYCVMFTGELHEGVDPARVRAGLVKVFQISEGQAASILAGGERLIKRDLTEEKAARWLEVLGGLGMVARVEAPEPPLLDLPEMGEEVPAAEQGPAEHAFRFTGQAGEYFRIWIVNVLLSIVTVGIYSAWAKVRNNRYFYGNTEVAGDRFDYTARPLAILKGRIIAVVLFLIYAFANSTHSPLALVALLLLMGVMPWLVARSLAFRNRNTTLRNIRFGFDGGYGGAAKAFILWPLVGALSLGLLMPLALREQDRYMVGNARYGTTPFAFDAALKSYYKILGGTLLILIGGIVGTVLLSMAMGGGLAALGGPQAAGSPAMQVAAMVPTLSILVAYLFAFAYFAAKRHNLIYNSSRFADHGFTASLAPLRLGWIQASNWLVTLLTLGLARPWAKVRLARYKADCLTLVAAGGLDAFTAAEEVRMSALGEEVGEAFDFDIGF